MPETIVRCSSPICKVSFNSLSLFFTSSAATTLAVRRSSLSTSSIVISGFTGSIAGLFAAWAAALAACSISESSANSFFTSMRGKSAVPFLSTVPTGRLP